MEAASASEAMEQESINSEDEASGSNGWPLGLAPVNDRISGVAAAAATSGALSPLSSCTPTSPSSSSSSSAFDSESTTSFFPEKSTSLGALIGIESSSQLLPVQNNMPEESRTGRSGHRRLLSSLFGCTRALHNPLEASPSLTHYLESHRGTTLQTFCSCPRNAPDDGSNAGETRGIVLNNNWGRSYSYSPSLHLILQQSSPQSSSSDHNIFSTRQRTRTMGSRLHSFWIGFCGKLSSSIVT